MIRDTVIATQQDGVNVIHHYHHHSVLTDNINGTWGTPISSSNVSAGDKFYNHFSYKCKNPISDTTWEVNNLSLICYLTDLNTYEVIQVIKEDVEF